MALESTRLFAVPGLQSGEAMNFGSVLSPTSVSTVVPATTVPGATSRVQFGGSEWGSVRDISRHQSHSRINIIRAISIHALSAVR